MTVAPPARPATPRTVSVAAVPDRDVTDRLSALEAEIVSAASRADPPVDGDALAQGARAEAAGLTYDPKHHDAAVRRMEAAGLAGLAAAGALDARAAGALIAHSDAPTEMALAALTHPALTTLSLTPAVAALWAILRRTSPLESFALWRTDAERALACVHAAGAPVPEAEALSVVRRCLRSGVHEVSPTGLTGTPVSAFGAPAAALVWSAGEADPALARLGASVAARALATPLQLAQTVDVNHRGQQALVRGLERRLQRLSLDLHDGALQDVALVAGELRRLEDHLRPALKGRSEGERVRALLGNLAELVEALDADLREVSTSFDGPGMLRRPFGEAIAAMVGGFRVRSGIDAELVVDGVLDNITNSQRIALHRVIQESLTNVRLHAQAEQTSVTVHGHTTHIEAAIVDDGLGFDPASTIEHAATNGRLGLVGMLERVRLLGGRCDISSRRGEGTRIHVHLARYEPTGDELG